jgi:ubiquinone/menaquinone biosynthesis C-methylase UbiE
MDRYDVYAQFYDLEFGDLTADLLMIQQFAARCGSPILELACGTGRVLMPLAREGYRVTGIDVSPAMLEVAQHKVENEGLSDRVTLVEQDMRELDLPDRFQLAFIAVNSFMHLLSTEDQLATLARIRDHLNPGGILLLDLFNPDLSRLLDFRGQVALDKVSVEPETGHRVMRFSTETVDLAQQTIRTTFIADRLDDEGHIQRTVFPFSVRYLFRYELELLLRHARFEVEAIYGSYDLDEFRSESEKMIAVARRPD